MSQTTYFYGANSHKVIASNLGMYDTAFTWFCDGFHRVSIMVCKKVVDIKCVVDDYGNLVAVD